MMLWISNLLVEPQDLYVLFGRRVAEAREKAELTQQQLADEIGLSRASVANIEAGRQRIVLHQAIEISEALKLATVADLLPTDLIRPSNRPAPNERVSLSGATLTPLEADAIQSIVASS
ncbi:MAG: helix-turn-helix transcriptional regulator [Pseudomonadota bacterium]